MDRINLRRRNTEIIHTATFISVTLIIVIIVNTIILVDFLIGVMILDFRRSFPEIVLVIVHPDLENASRNPNLIAEILDRSIVPFLHSPT